MINRLRAFLFACKSYSCPPVERWTGDDRAILRAFLETETGKKLKARLLNRVFAHNDRAVSEPDPAKLAGECGYANGFKGCLAELQDLAMTIQPTETQETGIPVDLEHLSP